MINECNQRLKEGFVTLQYLSEKQHWNLLVGILLRIQMWVLRYVSMDLFVMGKIKLVFPYKLHSCCGNAYIVVVLFSLSLGG